MKRGEVWTVSGASDYSGKPRPVVIIQDDRFADTESVTVCLFTSVTSYAPFFRLVVEPSPDNGLMFSSRLMTDKITTVPKSKLGKKLGRLTTADLTRLNRSMLLFLGLLTDGVADEASP